MSDRTNRNETDSTEDVRERYALASGRLGEIPEETRVPAPYRDFFVHEAEFLLLMDRRMRDLEAGKFTEWPMEELERQNEENYGELTGKRYDTCYGNPDFAERKFGREMGPLLCFLYAELRGAVVFAYEGRREDLLVLMELFLMIYGMFEDGTAPSPKSLREALYWYCSDYCADFVGQRTREALDPSCSFARDMIMDADLSDLSYLYRFGEYVTDSEIKTAAFLNGMSGEEIDAIARTWTEGYRLGFLAERKDITIKKTVNIRCRLGFERVVRSAVSQFRSMGLESILYRSAVHAVTKRQGIRVGCYGAIPNPQYEYDHRNDAALFLDEKFVTRKLESTREAYESCRDLAAVHGGPACMEVFGEIPFTPEDKKSGLILTDRQQALQARLFSETGQIANRYIRGEERSFTIIAYPVPTIGSRFEEIFRATEEINNLDYHKYQIIQQKLIDALDQGEKVHVLGMNGNSTDLTIALHTLVDPEHQTNFENCVADVNIPVGEVFTSPLLAGTGGVLNVKQVYLEDYQYKNLRITVRDGMITDYTCDNFSDESANRRYIEENILFHHPTVPIGEFAIGTNTTAYRMARKYDIADKLPILIAEKMGPHFAFGDTCYSFQEDMAVYNPDGKEIIARDNERSLLRKSDPQKAYFGCHTDITIPYEELGEITVIRGDGSTIDLIRGGRFVLPGTEELNVPLEGLL